MTSNKLMVPKTEISDHNYDILLKCYPIPQVPLHQKKKKEYAFMSMPILKWNIQREWVPKLLNLISTSMKRTSPFKS